MEQVSSEDFNQSNKSKIFLSDGSLNVSGRRRPPGIFNFASIQSNLDIPVLNTFGISIFNSSLEF